MPVEILFVRHQVWHLALSSIQEYSGITHYGAKSWNSLPFGLNDFPYLEIFEKSFNKIFYLDN